MTTRRTILAASLALAAMALTSCQTATSGEAAVSGHPPDDISDAPTFAQAVCAGCHATKPLHLSPNPSAPTFADIANREGVTRATLSRFLADAHNYPEAMDFDLEPEHVELLTDYMMTLKDPRYRQPGY